MFNIYLSKSKSSDIFLLNNLYHLHVLLILHRNYRIENWCKIVNWILQYFSLKTINARANFRTEHDWIFKTHSRSAHISIPSSLARTKFGKMANRGQPEMVKCWKTLNRLGKRQPVNTSDPLDYYTCMRTPPAQKVTRVAQTKIHSARVSRITNLDYSSVCLCRARELVDVLE